MVTIKLRKHDERNDEDESYALIPHRFALIFTNRKSYRKFKLSVNNLIDYVWR